MKARNLLPPDLLFTVSIADNHGHVVASSHPSAITSVADQDYFENQRQTDALSIGRPRPSLGSEVWETAIQPPLNTDDGGFAGIVVVSVDADYFVSGYETSTLGEHGVLGILGTDSIFRVRRSGETVSAGDLADYSSVVPATDEAESEAKLSTNSWDGVRRYTSARQLYDFPLAVIVGLSVDDQLAPTRRDMRTYLWRAIAGSILLILIVAMLSRMSAQLTDSHSQLLQSEKWPRSASSLPVSHTRSTIRSGYVHSNLTTLTRYMPDIFSVLDAYEQLEPSLVGAHAEIAPLQALKERVELAYLREDITSLLTESIEGITRVEKIVRDLKDFSHVDQAEWQHVDLRVGLETTLNVVWHELKYKAELVKDMAICQRSNAWHRKSIRCS